ncbi:MAG: nuclear transport factor 2 family protein [Betaproteobacteria bacterium]|nr:nuclear transport factor 2 family protein [Betaproteobacteria bacterium]
MHPELFRREMDPIAHVRDSILESRESAKQSLLSTHEGLFNDAKSAPIAVASAMTSERGAEKAVADTIAAWLDAWSNRDVESYLSFYGPAFTTGDPGFSFLVWSEMRRDRLRKPRWISVKARGVQIAMNGSDEATVSFQQDYRSPVLSETTNKTLVLKRRLDKWQIYMENNR